MESSKTFCSTCMCCRPANAFSVNNHGKTLKTCSKHSKKHARSSLDQWDSFVFEIRTWSKPPQTKILDINYEYDLKNLPVNFGDTIESTDDTNRDFYPPDQAIGSLVGLIREAGGHRYWQIRTTRTSESKHYYCCSQANSNVQKSKKSGKRDRDPITRFPCKSGLSVKPDLNNRRLRISLCHSYHTPYVTIQLSPAVLEFIASRRSNQTPAEIYRDLQVSNIPDVEKVAQHQVYYQWNYANSRLWRHDNDPYVSATKFLDGFGSNYQHATYSSGNLRGLALYNCGTMTRLATVYKELVIDVTYSTNNSG